MSDALKIPSEMDLRNAIVDYGRICYERKLICANDGNLSVRLDERRVLITPSGMSKGRLKPGDMVIVDLEGIVEDPRRNCLPSSETPMHLQVYLVRSDVCAVIHAHPVFATALTVAGMELPADILTEVILTLGKIPVTEYAIPSSEENAKAILPFVRDHKAILLRQHGALTLGIDLEEALVHMERIEFAAEVFWRAHSLGHVEHLAPGILERLMAIQEGRFH